MKGRLGNWFTGGMRRTRRGGVAVEAALVLPILVLLTFGTVELGWYFYVQHTLKGAAQEIVRAGIPSGVTNAEFTSLKNDILTKTSLNIDSVTISPADPTLASPGTKVTVTVKCNWGTVGIRPLGIISASKNVAGEASMQKE